MITAKDINFNTHDWSVPQICQLLDGCFDGFRLVFEDVREMGPAEMSRSVEQLLLGFPKTPLIGKFDASTSTYEIVSDASWVVALVKFYKGEFKLTNLKCLTSLEGKEKDDLEFLLLSHILAAKIPFQVCNYSSRNPDRYAGLDDLLEEWVYTHGGAC